MTSSWQGYKSCNGVDCMDFIIHSRSTAINHFIQLSNRTDSAEIRRAIFKIKHWSIDRSGFRGCCSCWSFFCIHWSLTLPNLFYNILGQFIFDHNIARMNVYQKNLTYLFYTPSVPFLTYPFYASFSRWVSPIKLTFCTITQVHF